MGMDYTNLDGESEAAVGFQAGRLLGTPSELLKEKLMSVLVPQSAQLLQIDLQAYEDKYADRPRRLKGDTTLATAQSFVAFVNRHKTPETVISANEKLTSFRAVFNPDEPNGQPTPGAGDTDGGGFVLGRPGHADYTATYGCPVSIEWQRWMGKSQHAADSKVGMKHDTFIQFIEDNLLDIVTPENGRMLQLVRAFEAKKDVKFASVRKLENGDTAFSFSEETEQIIKDGLSLPSQFTISIPVFNGGTLYAIDANLRYRVSQGGLTLWYELVRPHKSLEHAFKAVADQIREGTEVPVFDV